MFFDENNEMMNRKKIECVDIIYNKTESQLFQWVDKNKRLRLSNDVDVCLPMKIIFDHFMCNREANKKEEFTLEDMILYLIRTYKRVLSDKFLLYSKMMPATANNDHIARCASGRWMPFTLTDMLMIIDNRIVDGVPVFRVSLHPQLRVEFSNVEVNDVISNQWCDLYERICQVRMIVPNYDMIPQLFFKKAAKPKGVCNADDSRAASAELVMLIESYNFAMECLATSLETDGHVNHKLYLKQAGVVFEAVAQKMILFACNSKMSVLNGCIRSDFTPSMLELALKNRGALNPTEENKQLTMVKVTFNEKLVTTLIVCSLYHCAVASILNSDTESSIVYLEQCLFYINESKALTQAEKSAMFLVCVTTGVVHCNKLHFYEKQIEFENKLSLIK